MKTVIFTACLMLALTGYSSWEDLARNAAGLARQQLPASITAAFPSGFGGSRLTAPGYEKQVAIRLKEALRRLDESGSLNDARVGLKQVRYVQTNATDGNTFTAAGVAPLASATAQRRSREDEVIETTGFYVATISYDVISPLTMESGATLLSAACSCGVTQVKLSDGFGMVKTFRCPELDN